MSVWREWLSRIRGRRPEPLSGDRWRVAVELEGTWYESIITGSEQDANDAAHMFVSEHVYKTRKLAFARYAVESMKPGEEVEPKPS